MNVRTSPEEIEIGYDGDLDLVLTHLAASKPHDHLVEYLASCPVA
ncbi:hypothetical protein [Saccharothrix violaceirubra]|uniref:Uncharacterized protein n=1 Tax=Saccharothrix violaceirubra TaxID=413306 RepID=A0A7W7T3X2_9PSEU|nr:hypothetical protein [Saccharothrix violaceirubra]MBB4964860.1 hypothetical protein [Saccharothrix violaceirubra]